MFTLQGNRPLSPVIIKYKSENMEQIDTYIQQARQQGQTDEQIRQSLLASDWNAEQVNSAIVRTSNSSNQQNPSPNSTSITQSRTQRMNRRTFAVTFFVSAIPWVAVAAVSNIANAFHGTLQNTLYAIFALLLLPTVLYWIITFFVATINRAHDIGWHLIVAVIFGFLTPFLLILALIPGQKGDNKYGSVPPKKFNLHSALIWW